MRVGRMKFAMGKQQTVSCWVVTGLLWLGSEKATQAASLAKSLESGSTTGVVSIPAAEKAPSKNKAAVVPPRDRFQDLTPAEREARAQLVRERKPPKVKGPLVLTPTERDSRRDEIRQRLHKRLESLRQKKKQGSLTAEEGAQLKRLVDLCKGIPVVRRDRPESKGEKGSPSLHSTENGPQKP